METISSLLRMMNRSGPSKLTCGTTQLNIYSKIENNLSKTCSQTYALKRWFLFYQKISLWNYILDFLQGLSLQQYLYIISYLYRLKVADLLLYFFPFEKSVWFLKKLPKICFKSDQWTAVFIQIFRINKLNWEKVVQTKGVSNL